MRGIETGPDLSKPWCYAIVEGEYDEGRGYVPVLVVEGEAGYRTMRGNGRGQSPWYWGLTRDDAEEVCRKVNADRGVSEEEAVRIVASSMGASRVIRGHK